MRRFAITTLLAMAGLSLAPVQADELPQAPQHVDQLAPVPTWAPEVVETPGTAPTVEPPGDLLVVDESTGGLSATGWLVVVLLLLTFVVPGWMVLAGLGLFGAGAAALAWRIAGFTGRRQMQARLDAARATRFDLKPGQEPFPF